MYLYSTTEIKQIVQKQNPNVDPDVVSEELRNTHYYGKHGFKKAYFSKKRMDLNFLNQNMMDIITSFIKNEKNWTFNPENIVKYKHDKAVEIECNNNEDFKEKAKAHKIVCYRSKQKNVEIKVNGDLNRIKKTDKIVAIDFEYQSAKIDYVTEMGITTYDNGVVKSFHYIVNKFAGNPAFGKGRLQRSFKFGETLFVDKEELLEILKTHIEGIDFLLGKSVETERQIINRAGLGFKRKRSIELNECHKNFNPELGSIPKLKTMAEYYGIYGDNFHNAGNDAYYTMQVFLKMKERIKGA